MTDCRDCGEEKLPDFSCPLTPSFCTLCCECPKTDEWRTHDE